MYETTYLSDDGSQSEEDDALPLPTLTESPLHHPDSCLGLSSSLLGTILDILQPHRIAPEPSSTGRSTKLKCLSIGSGAGLFEALLRNHDPGLLEVYGLEVSSSTNANKYLPQHRRHTVQSTSTLYEEASEYDVWLFVYPRDPRLVRQYLELACRTKDTRVILFLGPKADFLPPHRGDNDVLAAAEDKERPAQETFAAVLGSFSDHIEVCQEFSRCEDDLLNVPSQESQPGQAQSVHDSSETSHKKPFRSSIYSSSEIGLTSYEILCVLRQCDPRGI
ncbi:hypothetical protein PV05_05354 [Exophiala xenobiotica]|uniref:Uncharacterized protein n=1 Tax=Exophiala xenobiotica TaxID=348802 RepID=A0A0D2EMR8_9EURO|nr:uncharacterized protein PV05_05354 [Exophiala xenobiotica]KIW56718.1 hypothetical protein PV05_05354 [Exophiala xenobiotica]